MLATMSRRSLRPLSRALSSRVTICGNHKSFISTIQQEQLSVVYFTASWCGPCQRISPIYEQLATDNADANFMKVDVDDQPEVAEAAQITAMPTFQFFKAGQLLDKIVGADDQKLGELIKFHQQ